MASTRTQKRSKTTPDIMFKVEGLTKVYHTGELDIHALSGIDINLHEGELAVLLGPSGSGKSTLLNILGGLDVASAGQAFFRDTEITALSERELTQYRRDHVGFVFQFYNLIPSLSARENVALVTEISKHPMTPEDALSLVGLEHRIDHFPAQLSGGEQQRVAIALRLPLVGEPAGRGVERTRLNRGDGRQDLEVAAGRQIAQPIEQPHLGQEPRHIA